MHDLIQQAREIVEGRSIYIPAMDHLRALLGEIDRLAAEKPLDDTRLARCPSCGNYILLDAGDNECYYCGELLSGRLADSDRARLLGTAAPTVMLLNLRDNLGKPLDLEGVRLTLLTIMRMCQIVGISARELAEYGRLFTESKDKIKWLREMT